jgi:hypothetical protein
MVDRIGARIDRRTGFGPQAGHVRVSDLPLGIGAFEDLTRCTWREQRKPKRESERNAAITSHFLLPCSPEDRRAAATADFTASLATF